jgi:kumamolisin
MEETVKVTVYLQLPLAERHDAGSAADLAKLLVPITRQELAERRQIEYRDAMAAFEVFTSQHGLAMHANLAQRRIQLTGPAEKLAALFGAAVAMPPEIAPWISAVTGFGQRPLALRANAESGGGHGLWPTEVAALYGMPLDGDHDGEGQCVGIIALGGGYLPSDLEAAVTAMKRPKPEIILRSVSGANNNHGDGTDLDKELALDLQVLAGIVPAARIVIYFTDNSQQGLAEAIHQAVFDDVNGPQVLSISWGSAEKYWSDGAREAMQAALADAVRLRVTVVAASGDLLATAGETDGKAHVQFPGSSPYVLCCGGTRIAPPPGDAGIDPETVWNDGSAGTGGGISDIFSAPDYQANVSLPPSFNDDGRRRGVPDVAAAAAEVPGYRTILNSQTLVQSGTSAATPLWAGLIALANAQLGQAVGLINPLLYANPAAFRQVTEGNNREGEIGYNAGPGWNACTGLGTPRGAAIIAALTAVA